MMHSMNSDAALIDFILRAKRATYAGEGAQAASSRLQSHDLPYREEPYTYLDTYLGGLQFIGEEAVWFDQQPLWGMNYYGWMLSETIPTGFSQFLKAALLRVQADAPYRGPSAWLDGDFAYACTWQGGLWRFTGQETIAWQEKPIYQLVFHGGRIC